MKVKAFTEPNKERLVLFRLVTGVDSVQLVAVNDQGEEITGGTLLNITREGYLELVYNINPQIGLPLTRDGRMIMRTIT